MGLHQNLPIYKVSYDLIGVRRTGKKVAGRQLDGRTHDEYPAP